MHDDEWDNELIKKKDAMKAVCEGCLKETKECRHHWDCPMLTKVGRIAPVPPRVKCVAEVSLDEDKVAELVYEKLKEPKRGEWIALDERDVSGYWKCSACGTPTQAIGAKEIYKYCPFCGADMRGKDDD